MSPAELVDLVDFRYLSDALTREEALEILEQAEPGRAAREARAAARRLPGLHHHARLARVRRRQAGQALPRGGRRGLRADQAQGRRQPRATTSPPAADRARRVGPDIAIAVDANQRWEVDEAIDWIEARWRRTTWRGSRSRPTLTTSSATRRSRERGADPGRDRRAHRQPGDGQAVPPGRSARRCSSSTRPAWPGSTRTSPSCCWRPSSACACARTRAESACARSCSTWRCSTSWLSPATIEGRMIEFVDHLHEHFVTPGRRRNAATTARPRSRLRRRDAGRLDREHRYACRCLTSTHRARLRRRRHRQPPRGARRRRGTRGARGRMGTAASATSTPRRTTGWAVRAPARRVPDREAAGRVRPCLDQGRPAARPQPDGRAGAWTTRGSSCRPTPAGLGLHRGRRPAQPRGVAVTPGPRHASTSSTCTTPSAGTWSGPSRGAAGAIRTLRGRGARRARSAWPRCAPDALLAAARPGHVDELMVAARYTLADQSLPRRCCRCVGSTASAVVAAAVFNGGLLAGSPSAQSTYRLPRGACRMILERARRIAARVRGDGVPVPAAALQFPLLPPGPLRRRRWSAPGQPGQIAEALRCWRHRCPRRCGTGCETDERVAHEPIVIDSHLHVWDLQVSDYAWLGPGHGPLTAASARRGRQRSSAGRRHRCDPRAGGGLRWPTPSTCSRCRASSSTACAGVVGWVQLDEPATAAAAPRAVRRHPLDLAACATWCTTTRETTSSPAQRPRVSLGLAGRARPAVRRSRRLAAPPGRRPPSSPRRFRTLTVVDGPPGEAAARERRTSRTGRSQLRDGSAARPERASPSSRGCRSPGSPSHGHRAAIRVLDVALDAFGADRLMYGGDWPMTVATGGYRRALAGDRRAGRRASPDASRSRSAHGVATDDYRGHA